MRHLNSRSECETILSK